MKNNEKKSAGKKDLPITGEVSSQGGIVSPLKEEILKEKVIDELTELQQQKEEVLKSEIPLEEKTEEIKEITMETDGEIQKIMDSAMHNMEESFKEIQIKTDEAITGSLASDKELGAGLLEQIKNNPDADSTLTVKKLHEFVEEKIEFSPGDQVVIDLFQSLSCLSQILSAERKHINVLEKVEDAKNVLEIYMNKSNIPCSEVKIDSTISSIHGGVVNSAQEAIKHFRDIYLLLLENGFAIPSQFQLMGTITTAYAAYLKSNNVTDWYLYF